MHHDPKKTLADLRDHLARHDKPLAFLFGAGTSCAIRVGDGEDSKEPIIPAVAGLTKLCRDAVAALGTAFEQAWDRIATHCKEHNEDPNVESILSRLRMMLRAIGGADTLCGLTRPDLTKVEETIRKAIAFHVDPDLTSLPTETAHRRLGQWLGKTARKHPVEIFTVNYDVLIEQALEAERVPVFDGFVGCFQPFFHGDSLRRAETAPGHNWARLWKMHGSITWRRVEQDGRSRVVRGAPDPEGAMIYPSFEKYDESRQQPYSAFAERLSKFLEQDDALLIVCGFSFGDEHINNIIFGALENRPRTHIFALQFEELANDCQLVRRAAARPNIIVIGPETGILQGVRAPWQASEPPPFMTDAFELKEVASGSGGHEPGKLGRMKVGDFAAFTSFLRAMAN